MIITTHPADYIVDVGRETHLTCANHCGGIIQLARIADVPVSFVELDTGHMFVCEVCDLLYAATSCH
jgi:hypothetical protein